MTIIREIDGHYSIDHDQVARLIEESGVLKTLKVIEALADSGYYPPDIVEQIEKIMFNIEFDQQFHDAPKV